MAGVGGDWHSWLRSVSLVIEPEILHRLWVEHVDRLLLIARSIGEPAEDAVQEAFVRLATQQRLPEAPLAWLVQVTRNQLYAWAREGTRRRRREQASAAERPWLCTPAVDAEVNEAVERLRELSAGPRQAIVMHLWGGLTFQQIGSILGISRSSAHREYQRGLDEIRVRIGAQLSEHSG